VRLSLRGNKLKVFVRREPHGEDTDPEPTDWKLVGTVTWTDLLAAITRLQRGSKDVEL